MGTLPGSTRATARSLRIALACAAGLAWTTAAAAQAAQAAQVDPLGAARRYTATHQRQILDEYTRLLQLRNVATNVDDVVRNAEFISGQLRQRGFTTRLLSAGADTPPAVFGELRVPGAERTVIFYAHYDGQPASQPEWRSDPFTPVLRSGAHASDSAVDYHAAGALDPDWRIYARSASDDKAPIQALLSAMDALTAAGLRPTTNVKVLYEGEEERGSPHLASILAANRQLLAADLFVLSDGPVHQSGRMQVFFGARGTASLELTVYGALRPLHSGHYGNWAPNPGVMLTHLIDSMRDDEGRILIPGFYSDVRPLTPGESAALAALPDVETGLRRELALGRTEGGGQRGERLGNAIARPALNLRGLRYGDVGEHASNVISTTARASIDFRLVPDQTPERVRSLTEKFLVGRGWYVVHAEPDSATRMAHPRVVRTEWSLDYPAYRTDLDAPAARGIVASIEKATGTPVVRLPMLGGSAPMSVFARALDMPIIGVPIVNYDNNQHGANENLRLGNLWNGIVIYAGLLSDLGKQM